MSCGANVVRELTREFEVTLYFYNPNIYPLAEYKKRLDETKRVALRYDYQLISEKYDHNYWLSLVKGHEMDSERGERCKICYTDRLRRTEEMASKRECNYFATTLTVSPHKNSRTIIDIGLKFERPGKPKFFNKDFKKNNGFIKSVQLARELNLYRQTYCGCEFSIKGK